MDGLLIMILLIIDKWIINNILRCTIWMMFWTKLKIPLSTKFDLSTAKFT